MSKIKKGIGVTAIILSVVICTLISAAVAGTVGFSLASAQWPPTMDLGGLYPTPTVTLPDNTPGNQRPTDSAPPFGNENGYTVVTGNVVDIVEKVSGSIVSIISQKKDSDGRYQDIAGGSGVVISEQGHIVTNNHLTEGADRAIVIFSDGREVIAQLIGGDKRADIAVLLVENVDVTPIKIIDDSDNVRTGETAIVIGNAMGENGSVTVGIVSGAKRYYYVEDVNAYVESIQTDAAINPGNSGGALVNDKGELIGIPFRKRTFTYDEDGAAVSIDGMGYAISVNLMRTVAKRLIEDGKVTRSGINITGGYVRSGGIENNPNMPSGIYVTGVVQGGAGALAGITEGMVITHINGERIMSMGEFVAKLQYEEVGTKVMLRVVGPNNPEQVKNIEVTLAILDV